MSRTKQTKGICAFCGAVIGKGTVRKHLASCEKWRAIVAQTESKAGGDETLYHLRVQPIGQNEFWLDLEARGESRLNDLDSYLRAIWLECCGHLSRYSFGGWGGNEIAKSRQVQQIFREGVELVHIYDFGTSSETGIKFVATRQGKPTTKHPLALLVRNMMPEAKCIECGEPAVWLCEECLIEDQIWGVLCDAHGEDHPHDNYGELVRLVNSPRLGMCGYEGPAEPPY
jgi:hypothetical protein